MGLDHHCGHQAFDRLVVREDPTTWVRRSISRWRCSREFADQTLRQCDSGNAEKASRSSLASVRVDVGELAFERSDDPVELLADRGASGWVKTVWMAAITMWVVLRFTLASTLRMSGPGSVARLIPPSPPRLPSSGPDAVRDDQAHSTEPSGPEGAQELGPKGPVF